MSWHEDQAAGEAALRKWNKEREEMPVFPVIRDRRGR